MIYYFTGNGNSRWVAEEIAKEIGDEVRNMADFISSDTMPDDTESYKRLGVVFPIHSWYAPRPVVDFLARLSIPQNIYRFAVCTCGDDVGKGIRRLEKHFRLDAKWSVIMPETYIPMFNLDTDEGALRKIGQARKRITEIADGVKEEAKVYDVHEGGFPWSKTYIVNPVFVHCIIRSRGFHVEGECTECGTCVKVCPMENIKMDDCQPVWGKNCIHCMGCIHACPSHVIQYGKSTRKRGRYNLRKYL